MVGIQVGRPIPGLVMYVTLVHIFYTLYLNQTAPGASKNLKDTVLGYYQLLGALAGRRQERTAPIAPAQGQPCLYHCPAFIITDFSFYGG